MLSHPAHSQMIHHHGRNFKEVNNMYIELTNQNFNDVAQDCINYINASKFYTEETGKSVTMWNRVPVFFDTETSTIKVQDKEYSFVYISQFTIDNKIEVYSRNMQRMMSLLFTVFKGIHRSLNIGIHNTKFDWSFMQSYAVWTSGYPYNMPCTPLLSEPHKPITVTFTDKDYENKKIRIVDTALIFNRTLAQAGKEYNTPHQKKAGDLDYKKVRLPITPLTPVELDYCMYDNRVGCDLMEYLYKEFTDYGWPFPITSTSIVRSKLKWNYECLLNSENTDYIDQHKDFLNLVPTTKRGKIQFEKYFPMTYNEYKELFCDYLFRGGLTHGNIFYLNEIVEDVTCVDYTSSYPASMAMYKFPMTRFRQVGKLNYQNFIKNDKLVGANGGEIWEDEKCYIMKVRFTNLMGTTSHSIESESKAINTLNPLTTYIDNGRIWATDVLEVWLTELDYHNYTRAYVWDTIEILNMKEAEQDYLPMYVLDSMIKPYIEKAQLKKAGLPYSAQKAIVNAVYGMMVQRLNLLQYDMQLVNGLVDTSHCDYKESVKKKAVKQINKCIETFMHNTGEKLPTITLTDETTGEEFTRYDMEAICEISYLKEQINAIEREIAYKDACKSKILNPFWGLYITAYSRHHLIQDLFDIEEASPNSVVYYDTDSLYIKDIDKVRHIIDAKNSTIQAIIQQRFPNQPELWDLGQFEYDPKCLRFKHLGAKRYIKETYDKNGNIVMKSTIAGLKKDMIAKWAKTGVRAGIWTEQQSHDKAFEYFTNGMVINKFMNDKLTPTYFNDCFDTVATDYLGNTGTVEIRGGQTLSKVPFALRIMDAYLEAKQYIKA